MRGLCCLLAGLCSVVGGTGCDFFGGDNDGSGDKRTFEVTFENLDTEIIHIDFASRAHAPSNALDPMESRTINVTATIGEFIMFEAGVNMVTHGSASCQLTVRDPVAARVVWTPLNLVCSGFDGSAPPDPTAPGSGSASGGASSGGSSGA